MSDFHSIAPSVKLGKDVKLSQFINLYGHGIPPEVLMALRLDPELDFTLDRPRRRWL